MSECTNGEMRDLLPELVSGRLSAEMRLAVEAHVAECEECAEELALLRALRPAMMRGPAIDSARIAAAVRAQVPVRAAHGAMRRAIPWRLAMAAAAVIAVSVAGYVMAARGRSAAPQVAVVHESPIAAPDSPQSVVAPLPVPAPKTPAPRTVVTPAPEQRIAIAPRAPITVASTGVLDNVADLSDDDVRALTESLGAISALPSTEPSAEIDPLGATLDEQSTGGSR